MPRTATPEVIVEAPREKLLELARLRKQVAAARKTRPPRFANPGALAKHCEPTTLQTPALDVIDEAARRVLFGDVTRQMIFAPPQIGKSQRISRWTPLCALAADPTLRIAVVSSESEKARRWGRQIRRDLRNNPDLGLQLTEDSQAAGRWETTEGGSLYCASYVSGTIGQPIDLLIIDDPFKDRAAAESKTIRDRVWDFWENDAKTRARRVILMHCLTGDTPVMLADGNWRAMRDVRPGDAVATYEHGKLTSSVVENWANKGPDAIFAIRMKSGRVVRANARHPFLVIEDGVEQWRRTDELRPGTAIRAVTGPASPARPAGASCQSLPRACAHRTTARRDGLLVIDLRPPTLLATAPPISSTAMGSPWPSMTGCSPSRAVDVQSAVDCLRRPTRRLAGHIVSASTMTMSRDACADCCVTDAISPWATHARQRFWTPPQSTSASESDTVLAVEPAGVEDVYDLQIARTENFIAAGLVSHNTRWHKDDLAGRLQEREPGEWAVVSLPAIAESDDDPMGREVGEEITSANLKLHPRGYYSRMQKSTSTYVWSSLYQQRPTAAEGGIFKRGDWQYWELGHQEGRRFLHLERDRYDLDDCARFITIDLAASKKTSADYTVASAWAITLAGDLVLLDRVRDRVPELDHAEFVRPLRQKWLGPYDVMHVEESMISSTLVYALGRAGVPLAPLKADADKVTRALAGAGLVRQHKVWLPRNAEWLDSWLDEHADFPNVAHDDQVDTTGYAARVAIAHWLPPEDAATTEPRRMAEHAQAASKDPADLDLMSVPM